MLLEAAPGTSYGGCGNSNLRAYAWSDRDGYECYITVPIGVYDHLDDDEVATMDNVLRRCQCSRLTGQKRRLTMKLFDLVQRCHDIGLDYSVHPYTFNRLMFIGRTNHIYAENGVGTNLVSAPIDGGKTDTTCWSTHVMLARIAEAAKHRGDC